MRAVSAILLVLLVVLQVRVWTGDGSRAELRRLAGELAAVEQEVARLEADNTILARDVAELKSGSAAVEALARQDLGMVRRDETFYLLVTP